MSFFPTASSVSVSFPIIQRAEHRLIFTRDVFAKENGLLADFLTPREEGERVRVLLFWDEGLAGAFSELPDKIAHWFAARSDRLQLVRPPIAVPGGESVKNGFQHLERVWHEINEAGLCRHSYVLVIGGGAVLDMVGFAAATAHRGIPLVRLPTTSLSQADGGVGVKNGVNYFGKKNWLGSFGVPHAIVNDLNFLDGLPLRDRRAGLIEAVKVALIRDAAFFEFIAARTDELARFEREAFEAVIEESARQHIEHIATAGDPFERGSARPLDFGHWSAHKLEQMSDFRFTHGESVAIGMSLDLIYSRRVGLLSTETADRILKILERFGFALFTPMLEKRSPAGQLEIAKGLDEFREHMGGRLTIPLIRGPGQRVDVHSMDTSTVEAAIQELKARHG